MKNTFRFVLLMGLFGTLSACGKAPVLSVDAQLQPMVAKFQTMSAQYGSPIQVTDLIAQFGPMSAANELGVCEIADGQTPRITIRKDTWDSASDAEREELMFHELGHCVIQRKHSSQLDKNGNPVTIMNPYGVVGQVYELNHDYYMSELFKNADT